MYLKYTMYKPNIYIIWYIYVIVFVIKLGWGNIYGNVFSSDTVFLKDTLIKIKAKLL